MIIMSVDLGDARTGIAVCGKSELIASPVTVIAEKDFDECIKKTAPKEQSYSIGVNQKSDFNHVKKVSKPLEPCKLLCPCGNSAVCQYVD